MSNGFVSLLMFVLLSACSTGIVAGKPAGNSFDQASDERVRMALATLDHLSKDLWFIGYQSVQELKADGQGARKYMLLDFRANGSPLDAAQLDASITEICHLIYTNTPLIQDLSALGYDQVSVAFDDVSQYDCR